jgi:hypothetical protein
MKIKSTLILVFLISHSLIFSQTQGPINLDTVWVTTNKTTTIIFPENIGKIDIGSEDFGAEKYLRTLTIKVASEESQPTSILVIYGENIFHGTLAYKRSPAKLFMDFSNVSPKNMPTFPNENRAQKQNHSLKNLDVQMSEKRLNIVLSSPKPVYRDVVNNNETIFISLFNMIADEEKLYLKILILNKSKTQYQIDFTEFSYRQPLEDKDLKGGFDTKNVIPVFTNKIDVVPGKEERYLGFAIPRYSLSKKGELLIVVREKLGSRSLKLAIPYIKILECKTLTK